MYIKLSDHVSDPFVKDYSRRNGVHLCGCGGGMMNDVKLVSLTFVGCYRLDVPGARRLYIDGVEDLLYRYNTDRAVRSYLHNFPFTLSNLDFGLLLEDRSLEHVRSREFCGYCYACGE